MAAYRKHSDHELSALLKGGDEAVFAEIYNRHKGALLLHAFRMLQSKEHAKDVVQEVFAALWAKRETLQIKTTLESYLYGAVRNRILDFMTHQKVVHKYMDRLGAYLEEGQPITDQQFRAKELTAIIEQEIALLPPKMREVFELSRNQELSHKQIATQLNISDKTVKKQVNNAIKILRLKINMLLFFF